MYTKSEFESMTKKELKNIISASNNSYYNKAESIISDEEYDMAREVLNIRYPKDDLNIKVGDIIGISEWKKATHKIPMTSLNKVNTEDEFRKWHSTIGDEFYLEMDKLDGLSIEISYSDGLIEDAITRGDGIVGESILSNVRKMQNIKKEIPLFTGSIRGEIILTLDDFEKINTILKDNGEKEHSNPRNTATGIAKRYDGRFAEYLTVLFYDVTGNYETEELKMQFFKNNGIKTAWYTKVNVDQCVTYYNEYEKHLRAATKYDIDGLVIKANNIALQTKLGNLNGNPRSHVAWKFTAMKAETTIEGIEWSMGQNRRITPVALLKPIKLGGVVVKRASLHNLKIFNDYKLGRGDIVIISRRNDVIPYVESIITKKSSINFKPPLSCPECEEELVHGDTYLLCPNDQCTALINGNLNKWVQALNIMDISFKTIAFMVKKGIVSEPAHFYTIKVEDLKVLEGFGDKSANKFVQSFKDNKSIPLDVFLDGLNMEMVSKSRAETLIENGYDTLEKMQNAKYDDLVKLPGIGDVVANSLIKGLENKFQIILGLLVVGVDIGVKPMVKVVDVTGNTMSGKVVVFTGKVERIDDTGDRYTRKKLEELVYKNGGSCEDSISKNTTTLIQADVNSESSKSVKAKKMGIEIMSEVNFFKIIGM